jgi:segregation and condensation protein B
MRIKMETAEIKQVIEALLFVSERPLSLKELKDAVKDDYADSANLENLLKELQAEYENINKPYEIKFVADGWTFATKASFSPWIKKLFKEKNILKLSPSALETLAIIAYKQPITRAEIDELRGVESSGVINTLSERKLIKIVGRKEAIGHPLLYGTTQEFLKHFGLAHLSELPLIESLPPQAQTASNVAEPELPFEEQKEQRNSEQWSDMNFVKPEEAHGTLPTQHLQSDETDDGSPDSEITEDGGGKGNAES